MRMFILLNLGVVLFLSFLGSVISVIESTRGFFKEKLYTLHNLQVESTIFDFSKESHLELVDLIARISEIGASDLSLCLVAFLIKRHLVLQVLWVLTLFVLVSTFICWYCLNKIEHKTNRDFFSLSNEQTESFLKWFLILHLTTLCPFFGYFYLTYRKYQENIYLDMGARNQIFPIHAMLALYAHSNKTSQLVEIQKTSFDTEINFQMIKKNKSLPSNKLAIYEKKPNIFAFNQNLFVKPEHSAEIFSQSSLSDRYIILKALNKSLGKLKLPEAEKSFFQQQLVAFFSHSQVQLNADVQNAFIVSKEVLASPNCRNSAFLNKKSIEFMFNLLQQNDVFFKNLPGSFSCLNEVSHFTEYLKSLLEEANDLRVISVGEIATRSDYYKCLDINKCIPDTISPVATAKELITYGIPVEEVDVSVWHQSTFINDSKVLYTRFMSEKGSKLLCLTTNPELPHLTQLTIHVFESEYRLNTIKEINTFQKLVNDHLALNKEKSCSLKVLINIITDTTIHG
jgi:hypothetical protein